MYFIFKTVLTFFYFPPPSRMQTLLIHSQSQFYANCQLYFLCAQELNKSFSFAYDNSISLIIVVYSLIMTFHDYHVSENPFKITNLIFIPKYWQKSAKITIFILLKQHCTTMAENLSSVFQLLFVKTSNRRGGFKVL